MRKKLKLWIIKKFMKVLKKRAMNQVKIKKI